MFKLNGTFSSWLDTVFNVIIIDIAGDEETRTHADEQSLSQ